MDRRTFLGLVGAGVTTSLAGCGGSGDETATASPTPTPTPTPSPFPSPTTSGAVSLSASDPETLRLSTDDGDRLLAELTVRNEGSAVANSVGITIQWLDDAGNPMGRSTTDIYAVAPGETWVPRIEGTFDIPKPERVTTAGASFGRVVEARGLNPPGVDVRSELSVDGDAPVVEGTITNRRHRELRYIEILPKVVDDQGRILGVGYANAARVASGAELSFGLPVQTKGRADAVATHETAVTFGGVY